jgi:hypothetical protein
MDDNIDGEWKGEEFSIVLSFSVIQLYMGHQQVTWFSRCTVVTVNIPPE